MCITSKVIGIMNIVTHQDTYKHCIDMSRYCLYTYAHHLETNTCLNILYTHQDVVLTDLDTRILSRHKNIV